MRQNANHMSAVNQSNDHDKPSHCELRSALEWYFVCVTCEAKWFSSKKESLCPRCMTRATSRERLMPPWRR